MISGKTMLLRKNKGNLGKRQENKGNKHIWFSAAPTAGELSISLSEMRSYWWKCECRFKIVHLKLILEPIKQACIQLTLHISSWSSAFNKDVLLRNEQLSRDQEKSIQDHRWFAFFVFTSVRLKFGAARTNVERTVARLELNDSR